MYRLLYEIQVRFVWINLFLYLNNIIQNNPRKSRWKQKKPSRILNRLKLASARAQSAPRDHATVFSSRHCFFVYKYNCVKFYKKLPWTLTKEQSPRWKFSESWNFLDSFFTRTSQHTSFRGPEFVIKYVINNCDFYFL